MPQENNNSVIIKTTEMQQAEWLDEIVEQLKEFKDRVSRGTIILEGGYFDKSLSLPEIDVLRTNKLKLSIDYTEVK
ncbi:hypothetical protein [Enterococcus durans]|uniref:hypothetical protein n=1 Tax=Enterococcus durans TaxID=53345 RepID=UPI001C8CD985|nr:hypothetical protein [Enterococcus durans]MBX9042135.1 hypothetical protein [Enterococcus durans]MBX9078657.1 hypothetical protein [Enterococcus durans]